MSNLKMDSNRQEFVLRLLATNMTDEEIAPYLSMTEEEVSSLRA
ncbi:hypothetical protein [Streptococcus oriscaviae]|nr:hypothetical protein [Streptococcus oriscaviae]